MKKSHSAKLIILFRKRRAGAHSIEELFKNIINKFEEDSRLRYEENCLPHDGKGFSNKIKNILYVSKKRGTWIHVTGEVYYSILLNRKVIITIHDIALALRGNLFKRRIIGLFWYWLPCRIAKLITVISETSKNELIDYTGINPRKVRVIANPVSDLLKKCPLPDGRRNRVLVIGTKPNKNLERLFKACSGLDIQMHIIGRLSNVQKNNLKELNINYTNDFDLSFEEVKLHYENCHILTFVSTYEGFGMPIIEAQAVGRPVITSNISSMPEVAGEGALFVNPYSVEEIRAGIVRLMNDTQCTEELIKKGSENVKKYRTSTIAKRYEKAYRDLILA